YMINLFSNIDSIVKKYGDRVFLIDGDREITFSGLINDILKVKQGIKDLGIQKGDRVCLLLPNVYESVLLHFALLFTGVIIVPLNFYDKWQAINFKVKFVEAKAVIFWDQFEQKIEKLKEDTDGKIKLISFGENKVEDAADYLTLLTSESDKNLFDDVEDDENALILFTSGISGKSKAAVFTYNNISKAVEIFNSFFRVNSEEIFLAAVPLFHPAALSMILFPGINNGSKIVLHSRFDEKELIDSIDKHKVTFFPGTFTMFNAVAENISEFEKKKNDLKFLVSIGGEIPDENLKAIEDFFNCEILFSYGTTETLFLASGSRIMDIKESRSCGIPLNGVKIEIFNENRIESENFAEGEIAVSGEHIFKEYWNDEELTQYFKKDNWFFSEDIGRFDEYSILYFLERKDEIIFKGGFLVYPREIEETLMGFDKIKEVAVIAVSDDEVGQEIKAFITLNENIRVEPEEVFSFCRDRLPLYKCPKYLKFTPVIPKSSTGKVLKRFLRSKRFQ
ncbi:class I adenylate-forming enzyme family protein, partial [candidate division KSB1 bacterium]